MNEKLWKLIFWNDVVFLAVSKLLPLEMLSNSYSPMVATLEVANIYYVISLYNIIISAIYA